MKVAIINDIHFGARKSSKDFLQSMRMFFENMFFPTLEEQGIDKLLVLGDVFDNRRTVDFYALEKAKEMFFDKLEYNDIKCKMIVGNHDIYYKNTNSLNSLELLLHEYKNIEIFTECTTVENVLLVPWINPENYDDIMNTMKSTTKNVCMGHFEIDGFSMFKGQVSKGGLSKKIFSKFDRVFSGHYHHKSDNGKIFYLGSPFELTWSDYAEDRGFHIFDTKTLDLELIKNPYKMFTMIDYDNLDTLPKDSYFDDFKGKIVKVNVINKDNKVVFDAFTDKMYNAGCIDVKFIEDFSTYEDVDVEDFEGMTSNEDVFKAYIDNIEDEKLDKDFLLNYISDIHKEAVNTTNKD